MATILHRYIAKQSELQALLGADRFAFYRRSDLYVKDNAKAYVSDYRRLDFEYRVLCAELLRLASSEEKVDEKSIRKLLVEAYLLAGLLEQIYGEFLDVPRERDRVHLQRFHLKWALNRFGYSEASPSSDSYQGHPKQPTQSLRELTDTLNLPRRLVVRSRLFCLALAEQYDMHRAWVSELDVYARPWLNYLTCILFAPRLFWNVGLLAKHLIPGVWMKPQEKALGFKKRALLQMERRWFELGFDLVFFTSGLLNVFFFVGPLLQRAVYLGVAAQILELAMISLRAYLAVQGFRSLLQSYDERLSPGDLSQAEQQGLKRHIAALEKRIQHEYHKLFLGVANCSLLVLAISCAMPMVVTTYPLLSLSAALTSVLMTLFAHHARIALDAQDPKDSPALLSKAGFFAPSRSDSAKPSESLLLPVPNL